MAFANTNPNFYQTDVDDKTSPSGKRRLIFSTLESLIIAQSGNTTDKVLAVPASSNLTIHATNLSLVGTITIHGGDVKIVARNLHVAKGAPVVIDVSGVLEEGYDQPGDAPPAAPMGASGNAADGASLAQVKATAGKRYGQRGHAGGSIELVCDGIDLGDTLTLNASGSPGYPGHDGQDGAPGPDGREGIIRRDWRAVGSHGATTYTDHVEQVAEPGHDGQAGGAALKGGDGGSGGRVVFRHSAGTAADLERLNIEVDLGKGGIPGKPGKGGKRGRGGKTKFTGAQEYPQDNVDGPYASDGATAGPAASGTNGTRHVAGKTGDLGALGSAGESLFFNMIFQSIRLRYVDCSPRLFTGKTITFGKSTSAAWNALKTDTDWLVRALGGFMDAKDDAEALRKANLFALATGLQTRQLTHKTVFNKPPTWVTRETFESLRKTFEDTAAATKPLEASFYELAADYENRNRERLDMKAHQETLAASSSGALAAYKVTRDLLPATKARIEAATTALNTARAALLATQDELVESLKQFHCDINKLLSAAEMMAFCSGSSEMAIGMGMVQLFGIINAGQTKIPTTDGGSVDKKYFIHSLVKIDGDLQAGMETNVQDGTGTLGDGKTPTYLAQLDKLDDMIDQVSNAVGEDGVAAKRAIQAYRDALVARSEAILDYNATILTAGQYYHEYEVANEELQAVRDGKQLVTAYDRQIFSGYARRYQQQVEELLETLDSLARKLDFLTLGRGESFDQLRREWLAYWYDDAPPTHDTTTFLTSLTSMEKALASDSAGKNPMNPFPEETPPAILLSETRARLPPDLLDTLRTEREVTFTLVPASTKRLRPGEVRVTATDGMFDLRVSTVRPHVVGATTRTGVVRVGLTCEGDSRIDDVLTGDVYRFHHDTVDTTFDHFTSFVEPGARDVYEPVRDGHAGTVGGGVLDMVGLFGRWTLWLTEAKDGSCNQQLDLTNLTDVILYFKGTFRDHR